MVFSMLYYKSVGKKIEDHVNKELLSVSKPISSDNERLIFIFQVYQRLFNYHLRLRHHIEGKAYHEYLGIDDIYLI